MLKHWVLDRQGMYAVFYSGVHIFHKLWLAIVGPVSLLRFIKKKSFGLIQYSFRCVWTSVRAYIGLMHEEVHLQWTSWNCGLS